MCVAGRSGIGKTADLRAALRTHDLDTRWTTARETVDDIVAAMRTDRYASWCQAFTGDRRPLVIEHVEDLRGKARTMQEVRLCMEERLSRGALTILTLTLSPGAADVLEWVSGFADVIVEGTPPTPSRAIPSVS